MQRPQGWTGWADLLPEAQWSAYKRVLENAERRGIPFTLAGGFGTATHTGQWRNTKDMDVYVLPADHERMITAIEDAGFKDFHEQQPYDRDWTYRATDGNVIFETIWRMRNGRADVDEGWFERATRIQLRGLTVQVTPPEEMIWAKLYVVLRERCDWPDVLNYIYFCGAGLDWQHLLDRLGDDWPLLGAVLCLFTWLSPEKVNVIPGWLWEKVGLQIPRPGSPTESRRRATLFSAHDWFGSMTDSGYLERAE